MAIDQPLEIPEISIANQRIGDHDNEVLISGRPAGPDAELWTMHYLVRRNDDTVREFTTEHLWHTVGFAELASEADTHRMTFQQLHPSSACCTLGDSPTPDTGSSASPTAASPDTMTAL